MAWNTCTPHVSCAAKGSQEIAYGLCDCTQMRLVHRHVHAPHLLKVIPDVLKANGTANGIAVNIIIVDDILDRQ